MTQPNGPDIFLSYVREDEARARRLSEALSAEGWSVFWDRSIPPGETWHSHIGRALANARSVIVGWSVASIGSQWVLEEAGDGRDRGVLVPVLFEPVQPPLGFRAIQASDLSAWDGSADAEAFRQLNAALVKRLGTTAMRAGPEVERPREPKQASGGRQRRSQAERSAEGGTTMLGNPVEAREPPTDGTGGPDGQGRSSRIRVLALTLAVLAGIVLVGVGIHQYWPQPQSQPQPSWEAQLESPARQTQPPPEPGTVFRDTLRDRTEGPEMVVVPAGNFLMGDQSGKGEADERPVHEVRIPKNFAIGRYEVTFAEYDRFAAATGREKPNDQGWGRDTRPVINVSWDEATAYAQWLSEQTGHTYRLPTEAEWEYAVRATTTTSRYWSEMLGQQPDPACAYANVFDQGNADRIRASYPSFTGEPFACEDPFTFTAPVGQFEPNPWGLHDMLGNVWEWVADCWHGGYQGAPADGSAWPEANGRDCSRVVRGGGWPLGPGFVRSADRGWFTVNNRLDYLGFRLARSL